MFFTKRTKDGAGDATSSSSKNAEPNFLQRAAANLRPVNRPVDEELVGAKLIENPAAVRKLLDVARLSDQIKPAIQQLRLADPFPAHRIRLVEVTNALAERFEKGERLYFRGQPDDHVVLCTERETYAVKEVETSNTLLFVAQPLDEPSSSANFRDDAETGIQLDSVKIEAFSHLYFELRRVDCVSLDRLRQLLRKTPVFPAEFCVNGRIEFDESERNTLDRLLDSVQMSEVELKDAISRLPVVEIDGVYRWLSLELIDFIVERLVDAADTRRIDMRDAVEFCQIETIFSTENDFHPPESLQRWIYDTFFERNTSDDAPRMASARKLVRACCSKILRQCGRLDVEQFERLVERAIPAHMALDWSWLAGLAILRDDAFRVRKTVEYLSAEDLPETPKERLAVLFTVRERWPADELTPYLTDIVASAKAMNALLAAHCYDVVEDGKKVFVGLKP